MLKLIHNNTFLATISVMAGTALNIFEKYIFSDWQFLVFLLILTALDTILGLYRAWLKKELSSQIFSRVFTKLLLYLSMLVLTHVLVSFTVEGAKNSIFGWFSSVAYAGIMVRESLSILENLTAINPNILPGWVMDRLKGFDKSGNVTDININGNA